MHAKARLLTGMFLAAFVGCGPTATPAGGAAGRIPLPDNKGFFEITSEGPATARPARGKAHTSTIVAVFYGPDGTTPLSPAPSDVTVKIGAEDRGETIPLAPKSGDAKSPGRFASQPGPYPDGFRGLLGAKIDGTAVEVPFSFR